MIKCKIQIFEFQMLYPNKHLRFYNEASKQITHNQLNLYMKIIRKY